MKTLALKVKWRVQEMVYFIDRLRSDIGIPPVIIDYDNWKVLKDSTGGDP